MRWLDSIINSMDMNLSKLQETEDRAAWRAAIHQVAKSKTRLRTEQQQWIYDKQIQHGILICIFCTEECYWGKT